MAEPAPHSEAAPPGPELQKDLPKEDDPSRLTTGQLKRRNLRDLVMVALGIGSLAIIVYDFFYRSTLAPEQIFALELLDLTLVLVFAAEFVWRWSGDKWRLRFVLRNWFDVLGMVPMMATNLPVFRAFRLLRIAMVASRLLRMWAFVTGQQSAQKVFDRYRDALVEEVTDRVLLQTLVMVEDIAVRGGYVRALGDSLQQSREDIAKAAIKGLHEGNLGKVAGRVPGVDEAVRQAVLAGVDSTVAMLHSDEMQRTFETTVKNLVAEARAEIARKSWQEVPAGQTETLVRMPWNRRGSLPPPRPS